LIYFISTADKGSVKVGYTSKPVEERLRSLQTAHSRPLKLIGTIPGSLIEERSIHQELAAYHEQGEWFRLTPRLTGIISLLIQYPPTYTYTARAEIASKPTRKISVTRITPQKNIDISPLDTKPDGRKNPWYLQRIAKEEAAALAAEQRANELESRYGIFFYGPGPQVATVDAEPEDGDKRKNSWFMKRVSDLASRTKIAERRIKDALAVMPEESDDVLMWDFL
jgi:T5orf172 domain